MAGYKLAFKRSVAKDLRAILSKDVARLLERIEMLKDNLRPSCCEKLSGEEKYRVRQATYRIVYQIEDDALVVVVVKNRSSARGLQTPPVTRPG